MICAERTVTARLLRPGEKLPEGMVHGIEWLGQLNEQWVWVAIEQGQIVGVLLAAPVHGIALIMKLNMSPQAPKTALVPLLRRFLADAKRRHLKGYITWFDEKQYAERKLLKIAERAGATQQWPATIVAGRIPEGW